jgi:DNA-binding NtrC family response regulator
MPVRNGLEVFDELKKINPEIRALLSSGMLDNETRANAAGRGIIETVTKPYTTAELSIKIKKAVTDA